jgi:hypothetical protein
MMNKTGFAEVFDQYESRLAVLISGIRTACRDRDDFVGVVELVIGYLEEVIDDASEE